MLTVRVAGEPCAQGRPRAAVIAGRARIFDPKDSRNWKATAREAMRLALRHPATTSSHVERMTALPFPAGPVRVVILARFTCPKGEQRKREPRPERWRDKKPDAENVAKAVLDAATGVLWADDAQVADLRVLTATAAQGMAPEVVLIVEALPEEVGMCRDLPLWRPFAVGGRAEALAVREAAPAAQETR